MAYAAINSLIDTIERLVNSCRISVDLRSRRILRSAQQEVLSVKEVLDRLDESSKSRSRIRVNDLDDQIREAVCKFEDLLESHLSDQILKQFERPRDQKRWSLRKVLKILVKSINLGIESRGSKSGQLLISLDLQDLKQDVGSFINTVKEMKKEYINELDNLPEEENDVVSSIIDSGGNEPKMVGFSDQLSEIKNLLTDDSRPHIAIVVYGMAGIGKTALAKEIFQDPSIRSHFERRAWASVGRKYKLNEIAQNILAQVDPDTDKMPIEGDEKIAHYLKEVLKDKRCLIVLDDVWETEVWDYLRRSFPDNSDRRYQILLTTRLLDVAAHTNRQRSFTNGNILHRMRLMNEEESRELLCEIVFGEQFFPPQLEQAGKKIAQNCEGLPLMIVTVANLLSRAEKTPQYWNMVAEKQNSIFMDAYSEIYKVLLPSYEYLSQYYKACFLYMGAFRQNYEIPQFKLISMWTAEGILESKDMNPIDTLISNSLVIFRPKSRNWYYKTVGSVKTCRLHSSFWHLCNIIAKKNKFCHVFSSRADGLEGSMKGHRRVSIQNNILFGIKDICNSMEDDWASTARSLLCSGPYHQYHVPIYFGLRLLRVLDALEIRFYEFPVEILKLVMLRYLALTCNGKLPASISKLFNLQFLIVRQHLSIKSYGAPSYVPIEIWDMQKLKHIQIMGSDLPNPNVGTSMLNLLKLLDVSAYSCTDEVLKSICNLEELGIQIDLVPDDIGKPIHCLNHISHLKKLKSLKCIVVNPKLSSEIVFSRPEVVARAPSSMFPSSLEKLHLSGLGYPWNGNYMSIIGSLPNLDVLKLRCYAFRGSKWEVEAKTFLRLRFLLIEDTDLMQLKLGHGSFPRLRCLSIKQCYKLEELHWPSLGVGYRKIEVVDCNPLVVACVNQIKEARSRNPYFDVCVHSSWDDGNLKS